MDAVSSTTRSATAGRPSFDAELKAVTLAREQGELITLKAAEAMIVAALQEPVMILRQLPELGRDPEEQQRLTAFLNSVLEAMRSGAASACSSGGPTSCS